jgi:hypothetical protein
VERTGRMREAGAPSTEGLLACCPRCARPPGVVMFAPSEVPCNAERAQSEGPRPGGVPKSAAKGQYKTGARKLRPGGCQGPARAEGGKPQPDYGLPNVAPSPLSVVNVHRSVFKVHPDASSHVLRQESAGGTINAWRGMGDATRGSPIVCEGKRRLGLAP